MRPESLSEAKANDKQDKEDDFLVSLIESAIDEILTGEHDAALGEWTRISKDKETKEEMIEQLATYIAHSQMREIAA